MKENKRTYYRQEFIDSVDKVAEAFLKEKNSNHHRDKFFPAMIDKLGLKVGAEIGVDKAQFSEHILGGSKLELLYCIDCWMDDFGSKYKPKEYDPVGLNRMEEARKRISKFERRYVLMRDTSANASLQIPDESLDFCYIDGDHSLEGIYTDLYAWTPKVKSGGIVAGHDYKDGPGSGIKDYWGGQLPYHIKTVVDFFCAKYGLKLNIVGGRILSWWFVKNV